MKQLLTAIFAFFISLAATAQEEKIIKIKESFNTYSKHPLDNKYDFIFSSTEVDKKTYKIWYYSGETNSYSQQTDKRNYNFYRILPVTTF